MPSAIITGSRGFIGRHLTKQLLDNGWTVATVGRRSDSGPVDHRTQNVWMDLCDYFVPVFVGGDCFGDSVDVLVHLAGPTTHSGINSVAAYRYITVA
jgi:nucleoside-diphosphate-sugar epimerase